jgi:hypothetical protein
LTAADPIADQLSVYHLSRSGIVGRGKIYTPAATGSPLGQCCAATSIQDVANIVTDFESGSA